MLKFIIYFAVSFIIVYLFYYIFVIRKCKKNKKIAPSEVNLILSLYKIDPKKIDFYQMIKVVSVVTTFIISLIITTIGTFFNSTVINIIFGTLLSVVLAIIFYGVIGRHYERISNKKASKKN